MSAWEHRGPCDGFSSFGHVGRCPSEEGEEKMVCAGHRPGSGNITKVSSGSIFDVLAMGKRRWPAELRKGWADILSLRKARRLSFKSTAESISAQGVYRKTSGAWGLEHAGVQIHPLALKADWDEGLAQGG